MSVVKTEKKTFFFPSPPPAIDWKAATFGNGSLLSFSDDYADHIRGLYSHLYISPEAMADLVSWGTDKKHDRRGDRE